MLYGRDSERAAIDALLSDARMGRSGVLVIRGEAGIGKTALLEYAARSGSDLPQLHGVGIESEARLPFAGLHLLLHASLDRIDRLPVVQAQALRGALGLGAAAGADRFLVGLAVLSLLADLAGDGPLLCLIDDAQWVDQASADALLFAARRLEAEGIVVIISAREDAPTFDAPGLPELHLSRLDANASAGLLAERAGDLAPPVRDRVLDEAAGNPLALIELPNALDPAQRSGQLGSPPLDVEVLPAPRRIEHVYQTAIGALPDGARNLLLIAAADDTGELGLVLRAAKVLGASSDDLAVIEQSELIRLAPTTITFRHPLIRAAAYHGAPLTQRWAAHRALADALGDDVERRTRHLAALATGPDDGIAAELDASAERARNRGGLAAVVATYERAASLSTDPVARARRLTDAAEAADELGEHARAVQLVGQAEPLAADPLSRARLTTVRAHASYAGSRLDTAHRHLYTAAATLLQCEQPQRALWLLVEMVRVARATGAGEAASRSAELLDRLRLPAADPLLPVRELLRWFLYRQLGRSTVDLPSLPDAAAAALLVDTGDLRGRLFIGDACRIAGDSAQAFDMADAVVAAIRTRGAAGLLPEALTHQADLLVYRGRYRDARASASEALRIAQATGLHESISQAASVLATVAAFAGEDEACTTYAQLGLGAGLDGARTPGSSGAHWALALLDLGLGRADAALTRLEALTHGTTRWHLRVLRSTPDLVEAAVRTGEPDRATEALARFEQWAGHTGQPWLKALVLRCRAMLGSDDEAERYYPAALERHEPDRPIETARTALLYGEWLRRARRRADARNQLRVALDVFERFDARPWADRARGELRAAGESVAAGEHTPHLLDRLTPQELQVVRLAASGLSNRAIGAQLFLSPRTVGYHLYKAYPKLGVASRAELARLPF